MAWGLLAAACHRVGDQERSREALQILSGQQGNAYGKATYCAVVGKTDAMFAALDEAYQQRDWNLRSITSLASYDPYRADPRFHALLAKMNLA